MKWLLLISAILAFTAFAEDAKDEAVVTLTDKNFDEFIKSNDKVLVEFYAPWCGHCKALAPEYEKAAQTLKKDGSTTVLAKVDATAEKDAASKFDVQGFPTLKYFAGDPEKAQEYGGGRTADTIVSWIKKRELPALSVLEDAEAAKKFQTRDKLVLVGYFAKDSDESKALTAVAEKLRESVVTGVVHDEAVAKELGQTVPSAVLYRQFDEPEVKIDAPYTEEDMKKFVESESFPLVDEIGPENYKNYMDRGLPLVWIAVKGSDEKKKDEVLTLCKKHAADHKGKLSFTWVDHEKYDSHVDSLGIKTVPGLMIIADGNAKKYRYDEKEVTEEGLQKFFDGYKDGSLKMFLKSQEVPEATEDEVKVVVGKTFSDIALDPGKNVLVEFYAPWCGHCKRLAPEYEKVGEAFKDKEDVVIAKVDATENDTPEDIQGFPTLIFYPAGEGSEKVTYDGKREAEDIIKWIKGKVGGEDDSGDAKDTKDDDKKEDTKEDTKEDDSKTEL